MPAHGPARIITPRDRAFGRDVPPPRSWAGDPVGTAFFNAFSATFPQGERLFIDSVRQYRDAVSPALREQIGAFVAQEALHTREHVHFNRQLAEQGLDVGAVEGRIRRRLDRVRERGDLAKLGVTIALEHFTAIIARQLLEDPTYFESASAEASRLWYWHAMEEIEHKAVAFDTFAEVTRGLSGLQRWLKRSKAMAAATIVLSIVTGRAMIEFLLQSGMTRSRALTRTLKYLFVTPGLIRKVTPSYLQFYRPGFHPWDEDDAHLILAGQLGGGQPVRNTVA